LSAQRRGRLRVIAPATSGAAVPPPPVMKLSKRSSLPRTPGLARSRWSSSGQPPIGKPWPKVQMIEAAGGQIAAQNSASAGDTHWAKVMCSLTPPSWVMSPTTSSEPRGVRRVANRPAAGKAESRQACCVPLRSCRSWLEGTVRSCWAPSSRIRFSRSRTIEAPVDWARDGPGQLTSSSVPRFFAQVWMDQICLRPLAGSGFRLTLNEGAEPSLGAPGPE
jgi:hypothetical protein